MAEPAPAPTSRRLARLVWILVATLVGAFGAAIVLAVVDLYLTGHGHPSIARSWIAWRPAGVHLSRADVLMLAVAGTAGYVQWKRSDHPA